MAGITGRGAKEEQWATHQVTAPFEGSHGDLRRRDRDSREDVADCDQDDGQEEAETLVDPGWNGIGGAREAILQFVVFVLQVAKLFAHQEGGLVVNTRTVPTRLLPREAARDGDLCTVSPASRLHQPASPGEWQLLL